MESHSGSQNRAFLPHIWGDFLDEPLKAVAERQQKTPASSLGAWCVGGKGIRAGHFQFGFRPGQQPNPCSGGRQMVIDTSSDTARPEPGRAVIGKGECLHPRHGIRQVFVIEGNFKIPRQGRIPRAEAAGRAGRDSGGPGHGVQTRAVRFPPVESQPSAAPPILHPAVDCNCPAAAVSRRR